MSLASSLPSTQPIADVPFVDRRQQSEKAEGGERRQFGNSYHNLSAEGKKLAEAIDNYKIEHHRRYITTDELLGVIGKLGYRRDA